MSVISAVDVLSFLLVIVIVRVHASFNVSHELMSFQLKESETLHDSRLSSFHDAITSSQNRS